jgi:hypothetical protein
VTVPGGWRWPLNGQVARRRQPGLMKRSTILAVVMLFVAAVGRSEWTKDDEGTCRATWAVRRTER